LRDSLPNISSENKKYFAKRVHPSTIIEGP
jgi:hypothetical protein